MLLAAADRGQHYRTRETSAETPHPETLRPTAQDPSLNSLVCYTHVLANLVRPGFGGNMLQVG